MTSKKPTRATPFALAYKIKAIIPTKIGLPITKTIIQEAEHTDANMEKHLDWVNEEWEAIAIQIDLYH